MRLGALVAVTVAVIGAASIVLMWKREWLKQLLIPSYEPRPAVACGSLRRTRSRGGSWLGCDVEAVGRLVVVGRRAVDRG